MILVVDNYDSFTWNLVHYIEQAGARTRVIRNDETSVEEALAILREHKKRSKKEKKHKKDSKKHKKDSKKRKKDKGGDWSSSSD